MWRKKNYQVQWSYFQKCHKSDLFVLELLLQQHCSNSAQKKKKKTFAFLCMFSSHTYTHTSGMFNLTSERRKKSLKKFNLFHIIECSLLLKCCKVQRWQIILISSFPSFVCYTNTMNKKQEEIDSIVEICKRFIYRTYWI